MEILRGEALIVAVEEHLDSRNNAPGITENAENVGEALRKGKVFRVNYLPEHLSLSRQVEKKISYNKIKNALEKLLSSRNSDPPQLLLFYFTGHGYLDETNGDLYLCASDSGWSDDRSKAYDTYLSVRWLLLVVQKTFLSLTMDSLDDPNGG